MNRLGGVIAVALLVSGPVAALAEDVALVLVSDEYRRLPDAGGAEAARELGQMLTASGFRVVSSIDEGAQDAGRALEDFRDLAEDADRVFALVGGHVVSTEREAWLLGPQADAPTDITVGAVAVPLGPLLDIAAGHPGQAVVMVAPTGDQMDGDGLATGFALPAPQGVTVVSGPFADIVSVARDGVLVPGRGLAGAPDSVRIDGFVSQAVPFLSGAQDIGPPAPASDRETTLWETVSAMGAAAGYEAYLDAYPGGRYAEQARAAIRNLEAQAGNQAEAAEDALGLDRTARREIQRNLSLLGYDPRGIDGIFGPGSRAAIANWQREEAHDPTGYLTSAQIAELSDAAEVRAAALEREAAARKAEEEQRDAAYWRDTGRGGDEAGLRAYLDRYPDGVYSDVAQARLEDIEAEKRAQVAAEERDYWDSVRANDNAAAYRDYLDRYPNGSFSEEARARLDELTADEGNAAARTEESQVAGNGVTRLLVETRLKAGGYDTGPVDGQFNAKTRRAIRQFQRASGLQVSGYVTRATMVRLLTLP